MSKFTTELRDVREEDLAILFEYQREPEANEMAAFPAKDYETFIKDMHDKMLSDTDVVRMKCIVLDGKVIGDIVSWELEGQRHVGYWIGKAYWGCGYASSALLDFLKTVETSRPVFADVACHNKPSIRVLEKCGFQISGEKFLSADGCEDYLMKLDK